MRGMPVPPGSSSDGVPTRHLGSRSAALESRGRHLPAYIGRYAVLGELGRGGMGRVWRAYDPRLQREVAIKELLPELSHLEIRERLVAEARALARVAHPNVVSVYDVERRPDGTVVMVMEYVPGQNLHAWLATEARSWQEIIGAFVAAGRGLAAAHAAGLLHRDFKPANVLVEGQTVKVADFGLVKAVHELPAEEVGTLLEEGDQTTSLTMTGMVMGTPAYMAPEQHRSGTLEAATDQYAFCVSLWEALCGRRPFSARTYSELLAKKLEGPPAWADSPAPGYVVEAITRGLSPAPNDRWPSMLNLLDALTHDPADLRRRRISSAVAAGSLLMVVSAAWAAHAFEKERCKDAARHLSEVWGANQRRQVQAAISRVERPFSAEVAARTLPRIDAYSTRMVDMFVQSCEATDEGLQSIEAMDLRASCLDRSRLALEAVMRVLSSPDEALLLKAHEVVATLPSLETCNDLEGLRASADDPPEGEARDVAAIRALLAQAYAERTAGRLDRAGSLLAEAEQRIASVDFLRVRAEFSLQLGQLHAARGEQDDARGVLRQALSLGGKLGDPSILQVATTQLALVVGYHEGHSEAGLRYAELATSFEGRELRDRAIAHQHRAILLANEGDYEEAQKENLLALELLNRQFGPDHPESLGVRGNIASVHRLMGRQRDAVEEHRELLRLREEALGAQHPFVASSHNNLANALGELGDYEEARWHFERALLLRRENLPPNHPDLAMTHYGLGVMLQDAGLEDEAESHLRRAIDALSQSLGPKDPRVAFAKNALGLAVRRSGDVSTAIALHREALALAEEALKPTHPFLAVVRTNLAAAFLERREAEEALQVLDPVWGARDRLQISAQNESELVFSRARALWLSSKSPTLQAQALATAREALALARELSEPQRATEIQAWLEARTR